LARQRIIHPNFFTNPELAELPMAARLLFIALWTLADNEGRLEDSPARIRLASLPYDQEDIDALLVTLATAGFIVRYAVDGRKFLEVTNFKRFQHPHPNEAKSVIPASTSDNVIASNVILPDLKPSVVMPSDLKPSVKTPLSVSPSAKPDVGWWVSLHNEFATKNGWPTMRPPKGARLVKLRARLRETPDPGTWREVYGRVENWTWLRDTKCNGWRPNAAFMLRPDTVDRALEGDFGGGKSQALTEVDAIFKRVDKLAARES